MEGLTMPAALADWLAGSETIPFVPEAWREGAATVRLTGSMTAARTYVDGSRRLAVPFEVRVRCRGRAVSDRLGAVDFYRQLGRYVRTHLMPVIPPADGAGAWIRGEVTETGGPAKSAVYENGDEEYRAAYVLTVFCPKDEE
ncbi:MAG: hypothetical protein II557_00405 [Clostridia bacterium]|nr:hypothetical protein [Clostridia bacterium]MBR4184215.1 hypothetical protein [Clostridia bacterium]